MQSKSDRTKKETTKNDLQADLVICGLFICEFAYMRSRNMDQNSLYATFYFNLPRIYAIFNKNQEF